mgnify:FL=1
MKWAFSFGQFAADPGHDEFCDIVLFLRGHWPALRYLVPFGYTGAATGGRGMLGSEDRMAAIWCLFAVVSWIGRSQTGMNEVSAVSSDRVQPFGLDVFLILL